MNGLTWFRDNWIGFFESLAESRPAARCWREDGLVIGISGLPVAAFNSVIVLDPGVLTPTHLKEFADLFTIEGLPFTILVSAQEQTPTCAELMHENGYIEMFVDPVMIREGPLVSPQLNPQVEIRPVTGPADRLAYQQIVTDVFGLPGEITKVFEVMWTIRGAQHVLAWLNGKAVGTGMLLCTNGTAAIYNVSTLSEFRQQGVGSTMMQALHMRALESGLGATVLASYPASYALYQNLGYRLDGYQISYSYLTLGS